MFCQQTTKPTRTIDLSADIHPATYFTRLQPHPTNQSLLCCTKTRSIIYGTNIALKGSISCYNPDGTRIYSASSQGINIYSFDGTSATHKSTISFPVIEHIEKGFLIPFFTTLVCYLTSIDDYHLVVLFTKTETDQGCLTTIFRFSEVFLTVCLIFQEQMVL